MKNVTCEIVQDLLPLYCDGVCSEDSRALIQAHIQSCDKCAQELRLMGRSADLETDPVEIAAAEAASKAWKKNKRKAFHRGVGITLALLCVLAALGVGSFLGQHYRDSNADGDWEGLRKVVSDGYERVKGPLQFGEVEAYTKKGNYMAITFQDEKGHWHVGIFEPDSVFPDRWVWSGSLDDVRPGKLACWNWKMNGNDTVLVCFGAELPEDITGYTFTNSGVTYSCPVKDGSVLDFFFMPDSFDANTRLEPIKKF